MSDFYALAESSLIKAQLLTAMLGMGCTLALSDFFKILRHPTGVILGVGTQWLVVPFLGQLFVWGFGLGPGWAIGVLIITVIPGGAFSNLLTFLARGHTPLSIAITLVSTLCCVVTAPLLLRIFAGGHVPPGFHFPAERVVLEVMLYLLIPLGAGMAVYQFIQPRAALISKISIWTSLALVVTIAFGAIGTGRIQVAEYGWTPPMVLLLFAVVIHFASLELFRGLGRTDDETVAIGIEVSVRNGGVGLLLAGFFFMDPSTGMPQPEYYQVIYSILFYVGIQIWVPIPAVLLHRIGRSPLLLRQPRRPPPAS